jgi:D-serine dehydratase
LLFLAQYFVAVKTPGNLSCSVHVVGVTVKVAVHIFGN